MHHFRKDQRITLREALEGLCLQGEVTTFSVVKLAVIHTVFRDVNVDVECHLIIHHASVEPTFAADVC